MVLLCFFVIAVAVQLGYAFYFFVRIFKVEAAGDTEGSTKSVSVIICAHNEAVNIAANLPMVLSQNYERNYEVVVVDDRSDDHTPAILARLSEKYPRLTVVSTGHAENTGPQGKKQALALALKASQFDYLLLTDADCRPASTDWLRLMVAPLAEGKEIVAGYGGYNSEKGLLNVLVRWESLHTALQYVTYTLAGKPYMAVGRNLACTRHVLTTAQRSPVWSQLPSGDDDLLVAVCGTPENTAIVLDPRAFTYSPAKSTWHEWMHQKQRHLSTGKYYRQPIKLLLGGYAISHTMFWLSFVLCWFAGHGPVYSGLLMTLWAIRCAVYWRIWSAMAVRIKENGNFYGFPFIYSFPVFDIGWIVYNFVFFPYIAWKDKMRWK